jgi:hypothetical protein
MSDPGADVVTVEVLPKSTGAFVTIVTSPPSVIPSRQICVVDDVVQFPGFDIGWGLRCQTANVPVSVVLCVATYALKSATAVVDWFEPQMFVGGASVG